MITAMAGHTPITEGAGHTLITGGAVGSDLYWQEKAMEHGMKVRVMSFKGHECNIWGTEAIVEILSKTQLKGVDGLIRLANLRLERLFPCKEEYSNNLIRRNYYIVKDADAVVAIGRIKRNGIRGSTAWGVAMADLMGIDTYVYDLDELTWNKYKEGTLKRCSIPTLPRVFAGIGSRKLTPSGKCAIYRVLESRNESQ